MATKSREAYKVTDTESIGFSSEDSSFVGMTVGLGLIRFAVVVGSGQDSRDQVMRLNQL